MLLHNEYSTPRISRITPRSVQSSAVVIPFPIRRDSAVQIIKPVAKVNICKDGRADCFFKVNPKFPVVLDKEQAVFLFNRNRVPNGGASDSFIIRADIEFSAKCEPLVLKRITTTLTCPTNFRPTHHRDPKDSLYGATEPCHQNWFWLLPFQQGRRHDRRPFLAVAMRNIKLTSVILPMELNNRSKILCVFNLQGYSTLFCVSNPAKVRKYDPKIPFTGVVGSKSSKLGFLSVSA